MPINSRLSLRIMDFYATGITAMASRMSHFAFILMVISGQVLGFLDSRQMGNGLNRRDRGEAFLNNSFITTTIILSFYISVRNIISLSKFNTIHYFVVFSKFQNVNTIPGYFFIQSYHLSFPPSRY